MVQISGVKKTSRVFVYNDNDKYSYIINIVYEVSFW